MLARVGSEYAVQRRRVRGHDWTAANPTRGDRVGLTLRGIVRVANRENIGAARSCLLVLQGMDKFVAEQPLATGLVGRVSSLSEEYVPPRAEGDCRHLGREFISFAIVVYPNSGEIERGERAKQVDVLAWYAFTWASRG